MECLRSFLRRHLAGKPVVASTNVSCFSFFFLPSLDTTQTRLSIPINHRANKRNGSRVRVCFHVRLCRLQRPFAIFVLSFCEHSVFQILSKRKAAHSYWVREDCICLNCGHSKRWGVLRLWAIFKVCFSVIIYA